MGPAGTAVDGPRPPRTRRRRTWALPAAFAAVAVVALALTGVALTRSEAEPQAVVDTTPATEPCVELPYQPCGQAPAPGTDGERCLEGRHDLDGDTANGCEVLSDSLNGTTFDGPITANLVPADAVDRYPFTVKHDFNLFCDNVLEVTLTAPAGAAMRLDVLRGAEVLGTTVSDDGIAASVRLGQPDCFGNDGLDLVARVSWVGTRRTGDDYTLERRGSW